MKAECPILAKNTVSYGALSERLGSSLQKNLGRFDSVKHLNAESKNHNLSPCKAVLVSSDRTARPDADSLRRRLGAALQKTGPPKFLLP